MNSGCINVGNSIPVPNVNEQKKSSSDNFSQVEHNNNDDTGESETKNCESTQNKIILNWVSYQAHQKYLEKYVAAW